MDCTKALAERANASAEETIGLNVLVIYEDVQMALRASRVLHRTQHQLETTAELHVDFWRSDWFHLSHNLSRRDVDLVILSTRGWAQLSKSAYSWFQDWLERLDDKPRALAFLFDPEAKHTARTVETVEELRAAARFAGVDVFLDTSEAARDSAAAVSDPVAVTRPRLLEEHLPLGQRPLFREWGIND